MKIKIVYIVFFARWLCMILQIAVIFIPFFEKFDIFNNIRVFETLMFYPFPVFLLGMLCEFRWLVLLFTTIISIAIIVFAVLGIKHKKPKTLSLILIDVFVAFNCIFSLICFDTSIKIIETMRDLFLISMCSLCLYDFRRKQYLEQI